MICRACGTVTETEFADLDFAPASNSFLKKEDLLLPENYYPLKLFVCPDCFLVQTDEVKKSTEIFSEDYVYFSSFSKTWLEHSKRYVEMILERFPASPETLVMEIASNDGYLLQYFNERKINVLGIEPTHSTAEAARKKGIESLERFFGRELADELSQTGRKADLLIGNNVFAHVPDINDFTAGMKTVLKSEGVITLEFPHLLNLVRENQFDTIYHEHYSYLSLITVEGLFRKYGLEIFDVQEIPTHGGSLRIFGKHNSDSSKPVSSNVGELLKKEIDAGMKDLEFYKGFQQKMFRIKTDFLQFLLDAKRDGKKTASYGAAAKGNTLLNYCGIKKDMIYFTVDASPVKQGRFLPGSHIPVVNESFIRDIKPDYIIIFPWNIKKEIENQLQYIREWGGKLVIAVPRLEVW